MHVTKKIVDILIYDTSEKSTKAIIDICELNSWTYEQCNQLEDAVKKLVVIDPRVIIVEVFSRSKDIELLRALKKIRSNSIIVKYSETTEDYFFYQKRFGLIYDFVLKSCSQEVIFEVLKKAIDYHHYKTSKLSTSDKSLSGIKSELEGMVWKEQKLVDSQKTMGKAIIESIVHSIYQGMGFGNIVPIVDLLELGRIDEGEYTKVQTELLNSLIENTAPVLIMKDKLDNMLTIMDMNPKSENVSGKEFEEILLKAIEEIEKLRLIKNHNFSLEKNIYPNEIISNKEVLGIIFREILTNAMKFSPDNSSILISTYKVENEFFLVVFNDILEDGSSYTGIPPEMEFEIFEPFFKISNVFDERFYQEELGFGIGLTVVHDFIKKLGGNIHLNNVVDYVSKPSKLKIKTEVSFITTN
ncbi:MAG: hypothetical protein KDK36_01340 [Leptospiraceae bacterium]|nr:hypothetical protein [Leptospiraceae bacterium]